MPDAFAITGLGADLFRPTTRQTTPLVSRPVACILICCCMVLLLWRRRVLAAGVVCCLAFAGSKGFLVCVSFPVVVSEFRSASRTAQASRFNQFNNLTVVFVCAHSAKPVTVPKTAELEPSGRQRSESYDLILPCCPRRAVSLRECPRVSQLTCGSSVPRPRMFQTKWRKHQFEVVDFVLI